MSEVIVTVRGESERRVAPEHASLQVSVRSDGPERGPVVQRVTESAERLCDDLAASQGSGEVIEWSSGRIAVWSDRPWNSEGHQLPVVHHASLDVSATYSDVAALSRRVGELAETDEVQVTGIHWALIPATRVRIEREVAAEAVSVAVERARAYAAALGLGTVTAVEVADAGLLTPDHEAAAPAMMRAMTVDSSGSALTLQPADIVVTAAVQARFRAS